MNCVDQILTHIYFILIEYILFKVSWIFPGLFYLSKNSNYIKVNIFLNYKYIYIYIFLINYVILCIPAGDRLTYACIT